MSDTAKVTEFLAGVTPERRHREAAVLSEMFARVTGWGPRLWSGGRLGYGTYDYTYASGRSGTFFATGFAPRAAKLSIYILPGYSDFSGLLAGLGRHAKGKSCIYINKLEDVDLSVLERLINAGLEDLGRLWPVQAT